MARVAVILAVVLSLFVLSHARLSDEPTTTTTATATSTASSETSTDADREPSETVDPTVHVVPINQIGDGSLPAGDILRHIDFSLRRPIYHHRHHFRHFHGDRRHRMRAMEIALGADAIGLPGDRIPLRSSEEKELVKEEGEKETEGEKPTEEQDIEKREGDSDSDSDSNSDSDSDSDDDEKMEKMEKRTRTGKCKKNKKKHHLHRFHHHHHHRRHEQDEAEKIGFMKRFWDFLNRF